MNSIDFGSSNRNNASRLKASRYIPSLVYLFATISVVEVLLLHTAGFIENDDYPIGNATIISRPLNILNFKAPYLQISSDGRFTWEYHWFMNGGCARPTRYINEDIGPFCESRMPGQPYDLSFFLEQVDEANSNSPSIGKNLSITVPSPTADKISLGKIQTIVPFSISAAGIGLTVLGACAIMPQNRKLLAALFLMSAATVCHFVAATIITAQGVHVRNKLNALGGPDDLVEEVNVEAGFMAELWTAVIITLICSMLLATHFHIWRHMIPVEQQAELELRAREAEEYTQHLRQMDGDT